MAEEVGQRLRRVPWGALVPLRAPLLAAITDTLSGTAAEKVVDAFLRAHRPMTSEQRAACAEAIFGVSLWRRRLAWHAGFEDARACEPATLLFCLLRDLAGVDERGAALIAGIGDAAAHSSTVGGDATALARSSDDAAAPASSSHGDATVHGRASGDDAAAPEPLGRVAPTSHALPLTRPAATSWRTRESFPDWLADHLEREIGAGDDGAAAFARAVNVPGPIVLRANRIVVGDREALRARLEREGLPTRAAAWAPDALVVEIARPNLLGLPASKDGAFEVQDEGSQLLGALAGVRPKMSVLDFCAGAGGKTLQLASMLRNDGEVHAWDVDLERLERLRTRARHAKATCVRIHRALPPESLKTDVVLVDAPCSELGPLRRGPDMRWRIDPDTLRTLPNVQREILSQAQRHVRPGGALVYATCTINRAENEDVAAWFEHAHPDFARTSPDAPNAFVSADHSFRALPHLHGTDGFFAVVWRRRG